MSLLEVLAAAVIVFVVLATAMIVYFLSVLQGLREIVDSEVKAISRSVEHAIRGGARANLAPDRRSFFADVEGVRLFIPLPQPGQPYVELPDYNEDVSAVTHGPALDPGDIDWDQDGRLDAPAFAKPERLDQRTDGDDNDGDGIVDDDPGIPEGMPELLIPGVLGSPSPAYDILESDGDLAVDDLARYIIPVGLLVAAEDGVYQESLAIGPGNWIFQAGLGDRILILSPVDEDLNGDGFVSPTSTNILPPPEPLESALIRNRVPGAGLPPGVTAFFPDTFEDRDGNARITVANTPIDINGDGLGDFNEFSEDFNLNGFLDVPVKAQIPGLAYYRNYYGLGPAFLGDPLTQGLLQSPLGTSAVDRVEPYQTANYMFSEQIQQSRNFGYTLRVERVEGVAGSSQGFGGIDRAVYRITMTFYYDYARTIEEFRQGLAPDPVRAQSFEVIVE